MNLRRLHFAHFFNFVVLSFFQFLPKRSSGYAALLQVGLGMDMHETPEVQKDQGIEVFVPRSKI